jgi:TonB family protein
MRRLDLRLGGRSLIVLLSIFLPPAFHAEAETVQIRSHASYTMGDGETASFAEAMVLQKAKQIALEEAGTYVEAYTKSVNEDLTVEEIRTIAGGVLQTEIVSLTRTLVGDGLRFDIEIKATVATDNMEELVHRIRGTNLSKEYEQLQIKYAQLAKDMEGLKRSVAAIATQPQRETTTQLEEVRERIREVEKEFHLTQKTEKSLYRRFLSGDELANELRRQIRADQERREQESRRRLQAERVLQTVIKTLQEDGHDIEVGTPRLINKGPMVGLEFTVKATASEIGKSVLRELVNNRDALNEADCERLHHAVQELALVVVVTLKDGTQYSADRQEFHSYRKNFCWYDWKNAAVVTPMEATLVVDMPSSRINEVISVEGRIRPRIRPTVRQEGLCDKGPDSLIGPTSDKRELSNPRMEKSTYLGQVRQRITSFWVAPIVDVNGACYVVVVKFRLHRNGAITGVAIERSSGNDYMDLAAKRAVIAASPLPAFPADINEPYFDARFTFTTGDFR